MKVQTDQLKRPKLIEPFFDKELLPDNSFCIYIEVSPYSQKQASDRLVSTPSKNISKKSCEVDKKLLSNLEKLKKAKTKFDIAWCLDHFFGYRHMVLLSDGMKKADLVAKKEAVLKKYEDLEK